MKTIKISEKLHRKLLPLTTETGVKRTFEEVIDTATEPQLVADLKDIEINGLKGFILTSNFFLGAEDMNPKNMKSNMAIYFEDLKEESFPKELSKKGESIKFTFFKGDTELFELECNNFMLDAYYGVENVIVVYISIDNYMGFCKRI